MATSPGPAAGQTRAGNQFQVLIFLYSLSLETWDILEEDEKDKRIRELEETLRKQKELMEILQKKLDDHPVCPDNLEYQTLRTVLFRGI